MNDKKITTSGSGDPYFYEWSIGQFYLLEMLINEEIEGVEIQATKKSLEGIDDVIVKYKNSCNIYIQVKNTRVGDNLTFCDLFPEGLIKTFSLKYKENNFKNNKIILTTNKNISEYSTTNKVSLKFFLDHLKEGLKEGNSLNDIDKYFSSVNENLKEIKKENDLTEKWTSLKEELIDIFKDENTAIEFLKNLEIKKEEGLEKLTEKLISKISDTFSVDKDKSVDILARLDHKLRFWATTLKKNEIITREEVLETISEIDKQYGNHFLEPPSNFFRSRDIVLEEIRSSLEDNKVKIIFLTGQAGVGKTTVVSKLKYDNLITFRYYSYKPIMPDQIFVPSDYDDLVKERTLWNDLLIQIREKFRQNNIVSKYKVPVLNTILTTSHLRSEVLRLLEILHRLENNLIVVVIDGIDHAARAGIKNSFISNLIPPDKIPFGVKFIISGQPANNYEEYPRWLKIPSPSVKMIEIKNINFEDIKSLTNDLQHYNCKDTLSQLIYNYTEGNTLSVIFAIEEAKIVNDINELNIRLSNRNLLSGLDNYYDNIWNYALKNVENKGKVSNILAIAFAQTEDKVTPDFLSEIFDDYSKKFWEDLISNLKPIINYDNGFYLRFNDVRVFLNNIIVKESEDYFLILNKFVDFYKKTKEPFLTKQKHLLTFMRILKRENEILEILDMNFLICSFKMNIPFEYLVNLLYEAIDIVIGIGDIKKLISIQIFSTLLNQMYQYKQYCQIENRVAFKTSSLLKSEIIEKVITLENLELVIDELILLIDENELNRAELIYNKWFELNNINEILSFIENLLNDDMNSHESHEIIPILKKFGEVIFKLNCDLQIKTFNNYVYSSGIINSGFLEQFKILNDLDEFIERFKNTSKFNYKSINDLLLYFFSMNKNDHCKIILQRFVDIKIEKASSTIVFIAIVLEYNISYFLKFLKTSLVLNSDDFHTIEIELAFIYGYSGIELENKKKHISDSEMILINGVIKLGKCLYSSINDIKVEDIIEPLCLSLYNCASDHSSLEGTKLYLRLIIIFFNKFSEEVKIFILNEFESSIRLEDEYPFNFNISSDFLINIGQINELKLMYKRMLMKDSYIWEIELEERNQLIRSFIDSIKNILNTEETRKIESCIKIFPFGYTGNDEVSLSSLMELYSIISERDNSVWKELGIKLLSINKSIDKISDNRLSSSIIKLVMKSVLKDGIENIISLNNENIINIFQDRLVLHEALIELISESFYNFSEIDSIWRFIIGNTVLDENNEKDYIVKLRNIIELKGFSDITKVYNPARVASYDFDKEKSKDSSFLTSLPLSELYKKFEFPGKDYAFDFGIEILNRLRVKITPQSEYKKILDLLIKKEHSYGLYHSEYKKIYEELFEKIVEEKEKWKLIKNIFKIKTDDIYSINRNIEFISNCFLKKKDLKEISSHFEKLLELHNKIVKKSLINSIEEPIKEIEVNSVDFEVSLSKILLNNFKSDSMLRIETTLVGLWVLFEKNSNILNEVISFYKKTDYFTKKLFHLLFMKISRCSTENITTYINQIKEIFDYSNSIQEKIGMYLILLNYKVNNKDFSFILKYKQLINDIKEPVFDKNKILSLEKPVNKRFITGNKILERRVSYLSKIIKDSTIINDIKKLAIANYDEIEKEIVFFHDLNIGSTRVISGYEYALDKVIYSLISNKTLDIPIEELIQYFYDSSSFVVLFFNLKCCEDELFTKEMFSYNDEQWIEHLRDDKEIDEIVLAASLNCIYENEFQEIKYYSYFDFGQTINSSNSGILSPQEIFLERDFEFFYERNDNYFLFIQSGGISFFMNDNLELFPSKFLIESMNFFPVIDKEGFRLKNDEGDEIKLEIITGIDKIWSHTRSSRPKLQRWVCKKSLLEKMNSFEKINFKLEININKPKDRNL